MYVFCLFVVVIGGFQVGTNSLEIPNKANIVSLVYSADNMVLLVNKFAFYSYHGTPCKQVCILFISWYSL